MKRFVFSILFFSTLSSFVWADVGEISPYDGAPIMNDFVNIVNSKSGEDVYWKFKLNNSILSGDHVYGESFFVSSRYDDGYIYMTSFKPTSIVKVYNPRSGEVFKKGVDYKVHKDGISIPKSSKIAKAPKGFEDDIQNDQLELYGVKVTTQFQDFQYAIDYTKEFAYNPKVYGSVSYSCKLCLVTFFGDSITLGANSTLGFNEPNQPPFVELLMSKLHVEKEDITWKYRNNSVGGWNTRNALSAYKWRVLDKRADIIVLSFGMNDGGGVGSKEYTNNFRSIIEQIKNKYPESSIILILPFRAHPHTKIQNSELVDGYQELLPKLTEDYSNLVVVDATSSYDFIMRNKHYYDMTGNGLNHPNDFGHRVLYETLAPLF